MRLLNALLTGLFDLLFWPFAGLDPIWALVFLSLVTGILMLWIFGKISNQDAIRVIRDRIRGQLIAIRLFGDDLGLLLRLQGRLLRDNAIFLKYALIPLLVTLVPVLLILIQLNLRYGARPLEPGRPAVVRVALNDPSAIDRGVFLEAPEGVAVETDGVRVKSLGEVSWRIRAERTGSYRLVVRAGDESVEKDLLVGRGWGATSTLRSGKGFMDKLLYPGEAPIASSVVQSIRISYEPLDLRAFGWRVDWVIVFFVLSIASGFAFRRVLGVEI